jgi:hypothetical protein
MEETSYFSGGGMSKTERAKGHIGSEEKHNVRQLLKGTSRKNAPTCTCTQEDRKLAFVLFRILHRLPVSFRVKSKFLPWLIRPVMT